MIRTWLRRLLLGWLIPVGWLLLWPLGWLMEGADASTDTMIYLTETVWDGFGIDWR